MILPAHTAKRNCNFHWSTLDQKYNRACLFSITVFRRPEKLFCSETSAIRLGGL